MWSLAPYAVFGKIWVAEQGVDLPFLLVVESPQDAYID